MVRNSSLAELQNGKCAFFTWLFPHETAWHICHGNYISLRAKLLFPDTVPFAVQLYNTAPAGGGGGGWVFDQCLGIGVPLMGVKT